MTSETAVLLAGLSACALACSSPPSSAPFSTDAAPASMVDAGVNLGLPDLTVYSPRTEVDFAIEERVFAADACELDPEEDCIGAAGNRRLLRFSVETPNIGEADFLLGAPSTSRPEFQFSPCHEHFHFLGFAVFRFVDEDGNEVADGNKQAFCVLDTSRFDESASPNSRFTCDYQGLQRGWSDVYDSSLPCQFIDITDLPDGDYALVVEVNAENRVAELDANNNTVLIPVTLGDPDLVTPSEPCPVDAPGYALENMSRECGWVLSTDAVEPVDELECTPGEMLRVGCADACELGSCSGDPMVRVCDAARTDGNCSHAAALGHADNSCGSSCPRTELFACPESGRLAVYTAARSPGDAYTCDVQVAVGLPTAQGS